MYQAKRHSDWSHSSIVQTKKIRTTFNKENYKKTCVEHLPNEVFYEIFEYLDGCDIYKSFYNLNYRFQQLTICSSLLFKIKFDSTSQSNLEYDCKNIIIPNRHHILSFYFENELLIDNLFTYCIINSSFNRLESIILNSISPDQLVILLFYLQSLPQLFSLTIHVDTEWGYNLSNIYRLIFSLPFLKYNKLSLSSIDENEELYISVPLVNNESFSSIEYLVINHCCTIDELLLMLNHTPRLRRLSCESLIESETGYSTEKSVILSNLTYLCIDDCYVQFNEFEGFIIKIASQLQLLRIGDFIYENYLDADRWEQLIIKYMPHLRIFDYKYRQIFMSELEDDIFYIELNRYTLSFWQERQWFLEVNIDDYDEISYSVHPYRKTWVDFHENTNRNLSKLIIMPVRQNTDNLSVQFVPTIELSIDYISTREQNQSFIDRFKFMFNAIQFTRLNINCKHIPFEILVRIIQLLPNLDSLKVSSELPIQYDWLFKNNGNICFLTLFNNKITKVNLEKIIDIKQVHFFLHLCPSLQYFKMTIPSNMIIEILVRFILKKANMFHPNLRILSLCIANANEEIVQLLQKLIDTEKLLTNYRIKRIGNDILLRWK